MAKDRLKETNLKRKGMKEVLRKAMDIVNHPDYVPPEGEENYIGKIPPNNKCRGWNSKRKKYCKAKAGKQTEHLGQGRCTYHGGSSDIIHGIYSTVLHDSLRNHLEEIQEQDLQTRLDILPEMDMIRAMARHFVSTYEERVEALREWNEAAVKNGDLPQRIPEMNEVAGLMIEATKIADRISKIESRDAIPMRDFFRIQEAMGDIVKKQIQKLGVREGVDEQAIQDTIDAIRDKWLEIRLKGVVQIGR